MSIASPLPRADLFTIKLQVGRKSINLDLDIIGLMCIPPFNENPSKYFSKMDELNQLINLDELSMGMSSDYLKALDYNATYLRIGSNIFGQRS